IRLQREMFFDILKVGALAAFSPLQTVLTVLVLTALVSRFGVEALAGYGIGARLEFLLVPMTFAVGVARARQVAWTASGLATLALGGIGLAVALAPDIWSARFTQDAGVRAAADLYLRTAGPAFAFLGAGMALYFASQGAGKVLGPVLASTVRLAVIAIGGWFLSASAAPVWTLFGLVALSMLAYGLTTAAAVYVTPWDPTEGVDGQRRHPRQAKR